MDKFLELTPSSNVLKKKLINIDKIISIDIPEDENGFIKIILHDNILRVEENKETIIKMLTYFGYKIITSKDIERMGG